MNWGWLITLIAGILLGIWIMTQSQRKRFSSEIKEKRHRVRMARLAVQEEEAKREWTEHHVASNRMLTEGHDEKDK